MSRPNSQFSDLGSQLEDAFMKYASPIKPYIPTLSRFLLVVTFFEDALRIIMQWSEQNHYMKYSRGFPSFTSQIFLGLNVIVSSILVL